VLVKLTRVFHRQFNVAAIAAHIGGEPTIKTILEDQGIGIAVNDNL
jgi:hypothetical protein